MNNLTALILTSNEEANIGRTFRSFALGYARRHHRQPYGTDRTLEIARTFPNVQVFQRVFDTYANQ